MTQKKNIGIFGVAALGIGSMVGAGVFALLGQIGLYVGPNAWLVFILSGGVALFSGYSYARLSAHYPTRGGVTDFFQFGFSSKRIERSFSILYLLTIVITLALIGKAFGEYLNHVLGNSNDSLWINVFSSGIIILLMLVNLMGSKTVGRIEVILVAIKLLILAGFIISGSLTLKPEMLISHVPVSTPSFFGAMGLAFFAYSGYGLMSSAAKDIKDPEQNMPRAFMISIGVVIILYVALSLVVLGNITPKTLAEYSDTAVAQAAEPILGHWGFVLISFSALIATASSITANIFSLFNISKQMGKIGTLPKIFTIPLVKSTQGFYLLVVIILMLINFFNLGAIASVASATFLICYLAVFWSSLKVRKEIHAKTWILVIGFISMMIIFIMFIESMISHHQWMNIVLLLLVIMTSIIMAWKSYTPVVLNKTDSSIH